MTTIQALQLICPQCKSEFVGMFHPSICTWHDPEAIQELYDKGYGIDCLNCGFRVPIRTQVVINAPSRMFLLDAGLPQKKIKEILEDVGLIDDNGKVLNCTQQNEQLRERFEREKAGKHQYKGTLEQID
ncbi:MAG: hypothetical protein ACFE7R_10455 [Candidatus Hodarchaeota archaeon]